MAENKKRVRPTWAQVRQLEAEIAELRDTRDIKNSFQGEWIEEKKELERKLEEQMNGTSVIISECNEWREKYRELFQRYDEVKDSMTMDVLKELQEKNRTLESSNRHMEEELGRIRQQRDDMSKHYACAKKQLNFLLSRGFWDRVFNKMPEDE